MKIRNVRNNVENKIRSILLDDGHFLFKLKKKSISSTWSYFDIKNNVGAGLVPAQRGITLIALIITIILMLILAGVVLSLTMGENGIFKVAKYAALKTEEEKAREKLELALADLQTHKYTSIDYYGDEDQYIDNYLSKEGMIVVGDTITVDGWKFEIDRSVPKVVESLGQGEESKKIILTANVENASDYTSATIIAEIEYEGTITEIKINGQQVEISEKQDGKYTISKQVETNGKYTVYVKDENDEYKTETVNVKEISEDMQIENAEQLVYFRDRVNKGATYVGKTITVVNNIDLGKVCYEVDGSVENDKSWEPIGNYQEAEENSTHIFKGTFNGNYHKIKNLYINSDKDYQGLFGKIQNATIIGLIIGENSTVIGNVDVGGIAGYAEYSTTSNCGNHGSVIGSQNVGGIIGEIYFSDIRGSYNKGAIEGERCIGGIVGISSVLTASEAASVEYCYNIGNITGKNRTGGIIGRSYWTKIYNCYNAKDIKSTAVFGTQNAYLGGIIADIVFGEVKYCYNTAIVDNTTSRNIVGGIAGGSSKTTAIPSNMEQGTSIVQYCYNSNDVTSKGACVGGIVGDNSKNSIVKDSYILEDITVKSNSTSATKNVGASSSYVGKIVGQANSNTSTYIDNIGTLSIDDMPSIYQVVNANEENGLNNGNSNYWSKTEYSNEERTAPKLKWESKVK